MNSCLSEDNGNQLFTIPAKWSYATIAYPIYTHRPVPSGLWNGEWNEETTCNNEMLQDVLGTCDESMSLLLGSVTSVGTLSEIAELVNDPEYGPKFMPGQCCLDNPATSEWFGYYVGGLIFVVCLDRLLNSTSSNAVCYFCNL